MKTADNQLDIFSPRAAGGCYLGEESTASKLARRDDSETSKLGAESVTVRAGSQMARLLMEYARFREGLTDAEAGYYSRLIENPRCGYWKRCSDLRRLGLLSPTGATQLASTGEQQRVCIITEAGKRAVERMERSG